MNLLQGDQFTSLPVTALEDLEKAISQRVDLSKGRSPHSSISAFTQLLQLLEGTRMSLSIHGSNVRPRKGARYGLMRHNGRGLSRCVSRVEQDTRGCRGLSQSGGRRYA